MWEIILPYFPNFFKCFGFFLFLPLSRLGLGIFSKISLSIFVAVVLGVETEINTQKIIAFFFQGVLTALPLVIFIEAINSLFDLTQVSAGLDLGHIYSPITESQKTTLSAGLILVLLTIYFKAGFLDSIDLLLIKPSSSSYFPISLDLVRGIFRTAFIIFLPVIAIFTLLEIVFGFFQKVLPSLNLFFETQGLKVTIFVFFLSFLSWSELIVKGEILIRNLIFDHKELLNEKF
ncbi:MAG: flagellar biosynthetic protein FliR [Deltaproteobacteria bacterium]|nr:flagellar biosynthetic protein FliR [Deltaproteobacteria bacterium]